MPAAGRGTDRRGRRASRSRPRFTTGAAFSSPRQIARAVVVVAFTVALAWLVVAQSIAMRLRETAPEAAVGLAPWNGGARDALANARLAATSSDRSSAAISSAVAAAKSALETNPLSVASWRVLGYAADLQGDQKAARRLITTAERMSRRDSLTQLWLIEDAVRRDDIPGAMQHYDAALRTSRSSRDLLLPILVRATDDPIIRLNVAHKLASNPPWRDEFIIRFAAEAPSGPVAADLLQRIKRTGDVPISPELALLVQRLAEQGEVGSAYRIYQVLSASDEANGFVRNGDFERENPLPPFDWSISDADGVTASQANDRLEISAASDAGGKAASQRLILRPGGYRLAALIGYEPGDQPASIEISVTCATGARSRLGAATVRATAPARAVDLPFTVPASCSSQSLDIGVRSETQPGGSMAWVDRLAIRPNTRTTAGRR